MKYITFPWEQLGHMLRGLSLSGGGGDAAAWALFLALGALPAALGLLLRIRRKGHRSDILLALLSAALLFGLWFFANPTYMDRYLSPIPTGGTAKYALAAVIDSLLFTWLLLRCIVSFGQAGWKKLLFLLRMLLILYGLALFTGILLEGVGEFRSSLSALLKSNTGSEDMLVGVSALFLGFQAVIGLLPAMSQVALLFLISGFLRCCEREPFGAESGRRMEGLKTASGRLLILVLAANVGFNVIQLLLSRFLLTSFHRIFFPLREIIVMLGIRTLSLLYLEGRRLKEDNDMFI